MKAGIRVLLFAVLTASTFAVPQLINYQGSLARPDGSSLDTTVAMTFKFYWDIAGPDSMVWQEAHPSVMVTDGLFNVELGSTTPIQPTQLDYPYVLLGVTVGNNSEMLPKANVKSTAYALMAASADSVRTVNGSQGGMLLSDLTVLSRINVGIGNFNTGLFSSVFGVNNKARGDYTVIAGGGGPNAADSNSASSPHAVVSGGIANHAIGQWSVIGGGSHNIVTYPYTAIGGGFYNSATFWDATVAGGSGNLASGDGSVVAGGSSNTASGEDAAICGGALNIASGVRAAIGGGYGNSVAGGYAVIPGGHDCIANGDNSFVAGLNAKTNSNASGSFVWGDNSTTDTIVVGTPNRVAFRSANGYRLYTNSTLTSGVLMNAGDGSWSSVSDSTKKRNRRNVDTHKILEEVEALPIQQWSYKAQVPSIEHIGPMAQDFYALFRVGDSDTTISTLDPDGIALAAIQELAKENAELKARLARLETQLQSHLSGEQQSFKEDK